MSRKKLIEALRTCGKSSISGRELENCYTADLMAVLREKSGGKRLKRVKNKRS